MTEDEQEALSIKYNVARIVRLSSGRFALFDPFANGSGMPITHIGSIEEIAPFIPNCDEVNEYIAEHTETRWASTKEAGINLLASLGLSRPRPPSIPLKRRI